MSGEPLGHRVAGKDAGGLEKAVPAYRDVSDHQSACMPTATNPEGV